MNRPATSNDMLYLIPRLTEAEGQRVCYWLFQNGPISERSWFSLDMNQTTAMVLKRVADRCISIEFLAKAIDQGAGKAQLASSWLAQGNAQINLDQSAEAFLNVAGRVAVIDGYARMDNEFVDFCNALLLPPSVRLELSRDYANRVYMALRRWYMIQTRTVGDLIQVLTKFAPAIIPKLGLTSGHAAEVVGTAVGTAGPVNDWRNKVFNELTPDNKQEILTLAGVPYGRAVTLCTKGVAEFWAALEQMGKALDPQIWASYPSCASMLGLRPSGTFGEYSISRGSAESCQSSIQSFESSGQPGQVQVKSKIGQAYNKVQSKKDVTCREFFMATDGAHSVASQKLIAVLDESGLWELVLSDQGLLENPEVAAEVVQRQQAWLEDQISPTKQMVQDLLDTQWANLAMKEFAEYLKTKDNDEITTILDAWTSKIEGKIVMSQKAGVKRFETAKTLNQFFMDLVDEDQVFSPEQIPILVRKFQDDHITTIKLLGKLKDDDLKTYGLKMGQIIVVREALNNLSQDKATKSN